jgi:hypothetical protein
MIIIGREMDFVVVGFLTSGMRGDDATVDATSIDAGSSPSPGGFWPGSGSLFRAAGIGSCIAR